MNRTLATLLLLALIALSIIGPPLRPDALAWVADLMLGRFEHTDPFVVGHFYLMGVWPAVLTLQLRPDLNARPIPAWPFAAGAFCLGAFALLPWFIVRPKRQEPNTGRRPWAIEPYLALLLGGASLVIVALSLAFGDLNQWMSVATRDNFVWTMTADFIALWLVGIAVAVEHDEHWQLALFPIVGNCVLLWRRRTAA